MPDPIVTSVVVDGVERWGASDAPWLLEAQKKAAEEPKVDAVTVEKEGQPDEAEVPAAGDGKDARRRNR